jgi:hypothetical protein
MLRIELDARPWRTEGDLIEAVIAALRGPSWHGRNYNALRDSMVTGAINEVAPPYEIVITGTANANGEVDDAIRYFVDQVTGWATRDGAAISARCEA